VNKIKIAEAFVEIKGNKGHFSKTIFAAKRELSGFGKSATKPLKLVKIGLVSITAAATAATVAVSALAIKGTRDLGIFGHQMAEVSTLLTANVDAMTQSLSKSVRYLSLKVPQSTDILTRALYDTISAGVDSAESIKMLGLASKAAIAGVSNVTSAVRLATSTVNALGLSFKDTNKVFDTAFATVRVGVITFEQLAGSLGQVLPAAKKLKSDITEVYGSIAFLTKAGMNAEMASISLARAFDALGTQSSKLEGMGIKIFGKAGDYVGIINVMEQIAGKMQGLTDQAKINLFNAMGFDIRAARAVITMTENLEGFRKTLGDVQDSAGATGVAYKRMEGTLVNLWKGIKNSFAELSRSIGEGFIGIASDGIKATKDLVDKTSAIISDKGGILKVWEMHGEVVVAIFRDMASTGLKIIKELFKGISELISAVALPAWQSYTFRFKQYWRSVLEDAYDRFATFADGSADKLEQSRKRQEGYNKAYWDREAAQLIISEALWEDAQNNIINIAKTTFSSMISDLKAYKDSYIKNLNEIEAKAVGDILPEVAAEVEDTATAFVNLGKSINKAAIASIFFEISKQLQAIKDKGISDSVNKTVAALKELEEELKKIVDKGPQLESIVTVFADIQRQIDEAGKPVLENSVKNTVVALNKLIDAQKVAGRKSKELAASEGKRLLKLRQDFDDFTSGFRTAFTNMFADLLGGRTRNLWERFWTDMANVATRKLAEIAVDEVFNRLFTLWQGLSGQNTTATSNPIAPPEVIPPPPFFPVSPAPANYNIIFPHADIEHMSRARIERLVEKQIGPAMRNLRKRGILAQTM